MEGWFCRKQRFVKRGDVESLQLLRFAVHVNVVHRFLEEDIEQVGQADHVVQVRVSQGNVQRGRRQMIANTKHGRTRVENDAAFGQHQARRVATIVRVIAKLVPSSISFMVQVEITSGTRLLADTRPLAV